MKHTNRKRKFNGGNLFLMPAIIVFSLIVIGPFIWSITASFTKWNGISSTIDFVGLKNYTQIFTDDKEFWKSFIFTIKSTFTITVLANILGLSFALLLEKAALKIQFIGRTAIMLPNVMSGIILGFIWKFVFTRGIPEIGKLIGLNALTINWLGTPTNAFWSIVIVSVWQWSGYTMIIYIAGLNNISKDVQEAAMLDGAHGWKRFKNITLPLIMPSVTICLFWTMVRSFTMFDLPFSLTEAGPFRSTETVSINLYSEAFTRNNYGLGSAKAIVFFLAILIITYAQVRATRSKEVEM